VAHEPRRTGAAPDKLRGKENGSPTSDALPPLRVPLTAAGFAFFFTKSPFLSSSCISSPEHSLSVLQSVMLSIDIGPMGRELGNAPRSQLVPLCTCTYLWR
jgi:hypothetical protein